MVRWHSKFPRRIIAHSGTNQITITCLGKRATARLKRAKKNQVKQAKRVQTERDLIGPRARIVLAFVTWESIPCPPLTGNYRLAREAKTETDRVALLDLAQTWLEVASREGKTSEQIAEAEKRKP